MYIYKTNKKLLMNKCVNENGQSIIIEWAVLLQRYIFQIQSDKTKTISETSNVDKGFKCGKCIETQ